MTDVEFLKCYRKQIEEVALLERQIAYLQDAPDKHHRLEQYVEPLQRQLKEAIQRRDADAEQFNAILRRAPNGRIRLVLRQYYGWALTDEAVAESIGISTRSVNHCRNRFLLMLAQQTGA